jgi:outer membrane protein OmpA-like peptidoglycan-associated protein
LAHTSGSGFKPNSDVHVYIFSTPILLGILRTDANGNFVGDLPLPAGLSAGDHTVQVDGYAPDNSVRTADVPVVYAASKPMTVTKSVFFSPDSTKLSAYTIKKITSLVKGLPAGSTLVTAKIVGFVYPINSAAANKKISNGRASNIATLLKKLGVTGNFTVIGAGRDKVADPTARRVDLAITYTTLVTAP